MTTPNGMTGVAIGSRAVGKTRPGSGGLMGRVAAWWRQRSELESLLRLDDRLLEDIGLTRGDIEQSLKRSVPLERRR